MSPCTLIVVLLVLVVVISQVGYLSLDCRCSHVWRERRALMIPPTTNYDATRFEVFVISLPTRDDRREHIRQQLNGRIDYTFFDAIRPAPGRRVLPVGKLGCALSHRAMWMRAVTDNTNILVFEDDIVVTDWDVFRDQIDVLLANEGWDLAFFGHCYEEEGAEVCTYFRASVKPLCLHAYMITPRAARLLLKHNNTCGHNDVQVKNAIRSGTVRSVSAYPQVVKQTWATDGPTLSSDLKDARGFK